MNEVNSLWTNLLKGHSSWSNNKSCPAKQDRSESTVCPFNGVKVFVHLTHLKLPQISQTSNQTKISRYAWLIWGNFKWVKWTNTLTPYKRTRSIYGLYENTVKTQYCIIFSEKQINNWELNFSLYWIIFVNHIK